MQRIGITGAFGFTGWHLRCHLKALGHADVVAGGRELFTDTHKLDDFVRNVDVIVHLAGMNRGTDEEIEKTNLLLATRLVEACKRNECTPHILYSSTIHIRNDSLYGRSKRQAGEILQRWAESSGAVFTNMILTNIFGEHGRPFYNSVVSTFCHQVAHQEAPVVNSDAPMSLLHAQDVAALIVNCIEGKTSGDIEPPGHATSVKSLLAQIRQIDASYRGDIVPDLRDKFQLQLFNTYRSYLYPQHYPKALTLHADNRGDLVEVIKSANGGQTFLSTTHPGITRGNHFHLGKVERFLVVSGQARISIRRLFHDEVMTFDVTGDAPGYIDMPTMHTHNIINTGDQELVTVFWSHELFDPQAPDTFAENV